MSEPEKPKVKRIIKRKVDPGLFKISDFNVVESNAEDPLDEACAEFVVQMFGVNKAGEQVAVDARGFQPFFYVRVGDAWTSNTLALFVKHLKTRLRDAADALIDAHLVHHRTLMGFDNERKYKFAQLMFLNTRAFNRAKNLWYTGSWNDDSRRLIPGGLVYAGSAVFLYEAQIPPLLRLIHVENISPSGWVKLPEDKRRDVPLDQRRTTCAREYEVQSKDIVSMPDMDDAVPYLKMSFDIEASSSHGDFPLPVKTYRKLATSVVDILDKMSFPAGAEGDRLCTAAIRTCLEAAFQASPLDRSPSASVQVTVPSINEIDTVFTVSPVTDMMVHVCATQLEEEKLSRTEIQTAGMSSDDVEQMFVKKGQERAALRRGGSDDGSDSEDGSEEETSDNEDNEGDTAEVVMTVKKPASAKAMKTETTKAEKTILLTDFVRRRDADRASRIAALALKLGKHLPKVEGDKVTFIGSTFMRHGEPEPYLNHCIVLDTCAPPTTPNTVYETYATEKEVLLAWTALVQRENPDMVLGYNIFGFDYEFMFRRAVELGCETEFLRLSKNRGEVCGTVARATGKLDIQRSTTTLASGTYELSIIPMPGRLQIDMLNWYRRNESLASYKLDNVASHFIGDDVSNIEEAVHTKTSRVYTKNLMGLHIDSFVHFEEITHSASYYQNGAKFRVVRMHSDGFEVQGSPKPAGHRVRWGLAKDDVTPKDIFRMTKEGPESRAVIAKYCIQDCNLVHYLLNKSDVITGLVEMARLCSVPISFLLMRGQGIKLTSFVAKKCREMGVLMPVLDKGAFDDAYEGAIVLEPKCGLYLDNATGVGDFGSLYPSSMQSENLCPSTKVWTKTYDLNGALVAQTGVCNAQGEFVYDNLEGREYVDVSFDTYRWVKPRPKAAMVKMKTGHRVCRYVQPIDDNTGLGIMPAILKELLKARKDTRKLIPKTEDAFMRNVLDKRQLAYKLTANSLYGQMGAKTSTFYEPDIAASTTATGRLLLTYAEKVIVQCYKDTEVEVLGRRVRTKAECVYGDTDSVFFKFNMEDAATGAPIRGQESLELTVALSQTATALVSKFLKQPHDFEYEKTFMPFCLLAKKRYVAIKYEFDPNKGKRTEMGIVLKRRDNAPIVKDVYGGLIDILMREKVDAIAKAREFVEAAFIELIRGRIPHDKLVITKSLRSTYKNPQGVAHYVLACRVGERDPGNRPRPGDRIPYMYVAAPASAKQKDRIEIPSFIVEKGLRVDYRYYIDHQLIKPIAQLFGLVVDQLCNVRTPIGGVGDKPTKAAAPRRNIARTMTAAIAEARLKTKDPKKLEAKIAKLRAKAVTDILCGGSTLFAKIATRQPSMSEYGT